MVEPEVEQIYAVLPLGYTCIVKNKSSRYLYSSERGLFKHLNPSHKLLSSYSDHEKARWGEFQIIDNLYQASGLNQFSIDVSGLREGEGLQQFQFRFNSNEIIEEIQETFRNYKKVDFKILPIDIFRLKSIFKVFHNNDIEFTSDFKKRLGELSLFCNVEILISDKIESFSFNQSYTQRQQHQQNRLYIYVIGDSDDTIFAETRLRVILDDYLGLSIDSIEIPLSFIPLTAGVDFGNFKAIAKETNVNLYLPTIVPELYQTNPTKTRKLDTIFLSGLESQVLLTKKLLTDLLNSVSNEVYYKNLPVAKFKIDNILIHHKSELSSIMLKYGVFIQVPPLGHPGSLVQFQGSSDELVELAINEFITMTNSIYQTKIWFQENQSHSPLSPVELTVFEQTINQLSASTNTTIITNISISSLEIIGDQDGTLSVVKLLKKLVNQLFGVDSLRISIETSIELGLTYHEFITGKKNGKLVKILSNFKAVEINFKPLNDYTFIILLNSTEFDEFFHAYDQLRQEFPSEVKFFIPESFHRQIIGTGGSLIQSIMSKYNVFVKFSNSYDSKSNLKNLTRYDNVIIRCPYKNSSNIPYVKNELNSLLMNNENFTFLNTFCKISRSQYRLLSFDIIQSIEKKTSTFIKFPLSEPSDFAIVEILGLENHSINATRLLINELPESYEFKISLSSNFKNVFNEANEVYLDRIKVPFKIAFNFEIMTIENKSLEFGPCHSVILTYLPDSALYLEEAIGYLTLFLRENQFMIIDRSELSNNDSIINGSSSKLIETQETISTGTAQLSKYNHPAGGALSTLAFSNSQQLYQLPNTQSFNKPKVSTQQSQARPITQRSEGNMKFGNIGHNEPTRQY